MCQVLGQRSIRVIIKLNNFIVNSLVLYTNIASNIYYIKYYIITFFFFQEYSKPVSVYIILKKKLSIGLMFAYNIIILYYIIISVKILHLKMIFNLILKI